MQFVLSLFLQDQISPKLFCFVFSSSSFLFLFLAFIRSFQYGMELEQFSHTAKYSNIKAIRFAWHDLFFSSPAVYSLLMLYAAFWYPPLSPAISDADNNLRQGVIVVIPHWRVFLLLHVWDRLRIQLCIFCKGCLSNLAISKRRGANCIHTAWRQLHTCLFSNRLPSSGTLKILITLLVIYCQQDI